MKPAKPALSEPPELSTVPYRDVLTQYGQTMLYAQQFEVAFKYFLRAVRLAGGVKTGVSDEEFQALLDVPDKKGLRVVLNELQAANREHGFVPMPQSLFEPLLRLVGVRNWLAHEYLASQRPLLEEASPELIRELRVYAMAFDNIGKRVHKHAEKIMLRLIDVSADEMADAFEEMLPEVDRTGIEAIRKRVAALGLD